MKSLSLTHALELMREGKPLMQMYTKDQGKAYYVVPGGPVEPRVAMQILKRPDCIPCRDGLFPGINQTWKLGAQHAGT